MGSISSINDLLRALRRQAWLIALVLAVGLPLAYVFAITRPHSYEATAVLGIRAQPLDPLEEAPMNLSRQLDEIQANLLSRDNLLRHAEQFDLFSDVESENMRVAQVRSAITMTELIDQTKLLDPTVTYRTDLEPYGMSIVVQLDDPEKAAALANALLNSVVIEGERRTQNFAVEAMDESAVTLAFLDAEHERLEQGLLSLETEIAAFRENNLASLPEGLEAQRSQLASLREEKLALDREVVRFEGAQGRVRSEVFNEERALLDEQSQILRDAIAEIEAALARAPAVERELSALIRRRESLQTELASLVTLRSEAAMDQHLRANQNVDPLYPLEVAVPPENPVSTSRSRTAMMGGAVVAAFAFALALALELLNPAIRNAAQMRREAGIEPVVVIPAVVSRSDVRRRRKSTALFVLIFLIVAGVAGTVNAAAPALPPDGATVLGA